MRFSGSDDLHNPPPPQKMIRDYEDIHHPSSEEQKVKGPFIDGNNVVPLVDFTTESTLDFLGVGPPAEPLSRSSAIPVLSQDKDVDDAMGSVMDPPSTQVTDKLQELAKMNLFPNLQMK